MGGGGVSAPPPPNAGEQLTSAIQGYVANAPALYQEEAQYQPQYNALQTSMEQQNIANYAQQYFNMQPQAQQVATANQQAATRGQLTNLQQTAPGATQALMGSSPQYGQLANYASSQMGAGLDPNLTGYAGQIAAAGPQQAQALYNLGNQASTQLQGVNTQLGNLSGQALTGANQQAAQLGNLQQSVLANARSDIFNQTKGNVMGALGNLDPLTQQLQSTAQQQLALGGSMSPEMAASVQQQQRAAYQARGMLQSTGSIGAEIMGQQQVQQQLLQQREQFASGVSPLVQNEQQQRTANAMGLTSTDIQATLANQQLGGQLGQAAAGVQQAGLGLAGGFQGQIGANLQNALAQQAGLYGQAGQAYTGALQTAGGLYGSALQLQNTQQAQGAAAAQYLTGAQQQNLASLLGYAPAGGQYASAGAGLNAYGTGGPSLFQSSGMLGLTGQNAALGYNANMAAQMSNASASQAQSGAMLGAIGSVAGAAVGGLALF